MREFEVARLRAAWFAWKDASSMELVETFKPIWMQTAKEIEDFSEQCGYHIKLHESTRVAFTLKPDVTLAFSPKANGYLLISGISFFAVMKKK